MKRCLLSALLLVASMAATHVTPLAHVDVFTSGKEGYKYFRIPAITTAADGTLLAFAEGRKYFGDDPGEVAENELHLVCKRSTDGGRTWSNLIVIENPGQFCSAANPAAVLDRDTGRVWVVYMRCKPGRSTEKARAGTDDEQVLARYSENNGQSWSAPVDLTEVSRDMTDSTWKISVAGPGGMIQDRHGRLVAAMWRYQWGVFALFSEDHGRTWQRGQLAPETGKSNENQLVELADGRLMMEYRCEDINQRYTLISDDGGRTWSQPRPGQKVTPVACAVHRYSLKSAGADANRLLWTGPKGPDRHNLVLRISYDEGQTFATELELARGVAAYSDITILNDGSAGVLWERGDGERGYRYLTFTRVTKEFLLRPANGEMK